jgi:hypothetical protein
MFQESSLFQFKNGDHICVFYRSEYELMQVLNPYIVEGLRRGERCFCAQKPETLKRLVNDLRFLGVDVDREIQRGALDLLSEDDTYLPYGRFEPEAMMDMLIRSIEEARKQGFSSFRSAGELSWAVEGRNDCDLVVGYEHLVNEYYPGKPAIGLCQYPINKFPADALEGVVRAHRMQLVETSANSFHSSVHVRNDGWTAEVVANYLSVNPRYYYVVQHREPRETVGWGVAPDFETAMTSVNQLAPA